MFGAHIAAGFGPERFAARAILSASARFVRSGNDNMLLIRGE
jgi:hypothetical protein